jgi:hypothetical protein
MTVRRSGPLLDQVKGLVASFTGDGVFDRDDVYDEIAARHPDAASSYRRARTRQRATRPRLYRGAETVICSSLPDMVGNW